MTDTPTAKVETKTQYVRAVLEKEIGSARATVVLQAVYEEAAAELESVSDQQSEPCDCAACVEAPNDPPTRLGQYAGAIWGQLDPAADKATAIRAAEAAIIVADRELESVRADRDRLAAAIEKVWQLVLPDPSSVLVRMDMIRRTVQPYLSAPEEGSNDE